MSYLESDQLLTASIENRAKSFIENLGEKYFEISHVSLEIEYKNLKKSSARNLSVLE